MLSACVTCVRVNASTCPHQRASAGPSSEEAYKPHSRNILNLHAVHATVSFAKLQKWHAKLRNFSSFEVLDRYLSFIVIPHGLEHTKTVVMASKFLPSSKLPPVSTKRPASMAGFGTQVSKYTYDYVRLHQPALSMQPCILYGVLTTNTSCAFTKQLFLAN